MRNDGTGRQRAAWWPMVCVLAVVVLALAVAPAQPVGATDFTVSVCDEAHFTSALTMAQMSADNRVIFACNGTITLTATQTITQTVTLDGTGAGVTIDGGGSVRLFQVSSSVTFSVVSLTLSNGSASDGNAGGIDNHLGGTVNITNSTLSGNSNTNTNVATGAAITNGGGTLTVTNSTISNNTANASASTNNVNGGGIANDSGTVNVTNSTISGNATKGIVDNGSGIYNASGTLTVTNSTVSNNTSAIGYADGIGIDSEDGTLTVTNSTISGNNTSNAISITGGGLNVGGGTATVINTLIVDNTANDLHGTLSGTSKNNVHDVAFTFANSETVPTNNGGPTLTLAIDATDTTAYQQGDLATCQAESAIGLDGAGHNVDQRGANRVVSSKCSIGAFEPGNVNTRTVLSANASGSVAYDTAITFTATVAGVLGGTPQDGTNAVTFKRSSTTLGTANLTGGAATFTTHTLPVGNDSITATYTTAGANYATSAASTAVSVTITTVACTVTSTADTTSMSGIATLRGAVAAANASACTNSNTITFGGALTGQTITLTSNTALTLTTATPVTIDGTGSNVTIDGHCNLSGSTCVSSGTTVFMLNASATLTLTALTIQHGYSTNYNGGVFDSGTLTVINCTFTHNTSIAGGAIWNSGGGLTVTGSTFANNSAMGDLVNSTGGAIFNNGGATITNSTFTGNVASGTGGGGGIDNWGTLTVTNSTFTNNTAPTGGGIRNEMPFSLTVTNTILAGDTGGEVRNSGGMIHDNGHNLVQDASISGGTGDITGQSPLLSALGSYGGTTQTFLLLPGSPAIGAGAPGTCANGSVKSKDQRGTARPGIAGLACDIGAFESTGFTVAKTSGDSQSTLPGVAFSALTATLTSKDSASTVTSGTLTFVIAPGTTGVTFSAAGSTGCTVSGDMLTASGCTITSGGVATSPPLSGGTAAGNFTVTASAEPTGSIVDATYTETVAKLTPMVMVASGSAMDTSTVGQSVTLTATVTGVMGMATPTGSVTFTSGGMTLGMGTLNGSSVATIMTSSLPAGRETITATYGGDTNYSAGAAGSVTQLVLATNVPPQPTVHATATAIGTPRVQPSREPDGGMNSGQTPSSQPTRH